MIGRVLYDEDLLFTTMALSASSNAEGIITLSEGFSLNPCKYDVLTEFSSTFLANNLVAATYNITGNSTMSFMAYNRICNCRLIYF